MGKLQKEAEVRYQRSCNHNYLVIRKPEDEKADYQTGMILENRIPFLLPAELRECEGEEELFYEISSLQPLSRIYEHKELGWAEVREIMAGILDAYEKLQDYLLDDAHVVLEPEQIYLDLDDHGISLLFYPYYHGSREESFLGLAEYLLDRIDHRDTSAAMFAYQMYKIVRRDNFVPEDIRRVLEETEEAGKRENFLSETAAEDHLPMKSLPKEQIRGKERSACRRSSGKEMIPKDDNTSEGYRSDGSGDSSAGIPLKNGSLPVEEEAKSKGRSGNALILPILLMLAGAAVVFGMIPGIRSGSTRSLTGALLILIGAGLLLLHFGRRRPPRNPEPEEIFAGLEPSFRDQEQPAGPLRSFLRQPEEQETPDSKSGRRWDGGSFFSDLYKGEAHEDFAATAYDTKELRQDDAGEDEESYGKTVFIEPEREDLQYILKEKGKAKEYFMKAFPYTIGKVKDCVDLALPDNSVSRIHARIMKTGEGLCLQDCRSTNGTFLNGMRLEAEEKVMIGKGDELGIGKLRFELV